jgi:hypothetical protein
MERALGRERRCIPVSNHIGSLTWAAACSRSIVLSPRGVTPSSAGYAPVECGRVRADGVDKRVERHGFTTLAAAQKNAQVKDAGMPMPLGPPPWRPPEPPL